MPQLAAGILDFVMAQACHPACSALNAEYDYAAMAVGKGCNFPGDFIPGGEAWHEQHAAALSLSDNRRNILFHKLSQASFACQTV